MQKDALNNVHIAGEQILITPEELKKQFPLNAALEAQIDRFPPDHCRYHQRQRSPFVGGLWPLLNSRY